MQTSNQSLTAQLAELLTNRIKDGTWPVGFRLPTEMELMREHNVGRITVRRALAKLEDAGLINRRPRVGTTVISTGAELQFVYSLPSLADINQLGNHHQRKILHVQRFVADEISANVLNVPVGSSYLLLSDLRVSVVENSTPMAFTNVYIPWRYRSVLSRAQAEPTSLIVNLIQSLTGNTLHKIDQHISSYPMPARWAALLNVKAESPALRILRHYIDTDNKLMMISESWHPGDRYSLRVPIERLMPTLPATGKK